MKTLPSVLLIEKNKLESTNPWIYLFELKIKTAENPDTFTYKRICNYDQSITFNSVTFSPFPVLLNSLEENTSGEIRRMSVTISNIDQTIISLLENYWTSVSFDPDWVVNIWTVDATQPTQTPTTTNETFEVVSATTNLITSTFEIRADGLSLSRIVPGRNYTRNTGFSNIPRKIR